MSLDDDIIIDNYLRNLINEKEQLDFEKRLESDIDFRENFNLEKNLRASQNSEDWSFVKKNTSESKDYKALLEEEDLKNLKKTLEKVSSEYNTKSSQGSIKWFYYLAAASIVLFLGFQFAFNQSVSNQDLYNDYVSLNELPSFATRGEENTLGIQLIKGQEFFEAENYKASLAIFEPILNTTKTNASVFIYTGISQTELGEYKKAENTFNTLINSDLLDAEIGYWYKALLFLKTDRVDEAKTILNTIVSKSLYKQKKAKQLLKDLEE